MCFCQKERKKKGKLKDTQNEEEREHTDGGTLSTTEAGDGLPHTADRKGRQREKP